MDGHGFNIYKKGEMFNTKGKYYGDCLVEYDNGQTFRCVVLRFKDLSRVRAADKTNYELGRRPFLSGDAYGYTEYGARLCREQNKFPGPIVWEDGKITSEVPRSQIRQDAPQQFFQRYDKGTNKGGGFVMLSPGVSHMFRSGMLFNRK